MCHRLILERDRVALAVADAAEWQARRAIIEKQSEEARREKQRRRAQAERDGEKARRSQVNLLPSLLAQQHRALSHPGSQLAGCALL